MTAPTPNAAKPQRRWFQYSLRTLLIFVTLTGCSFGWLGAKVRKARQQAAAVAAIEKLGGNVRYGYQFDAQHNYDSKIPLPGPDWLRALFGDDVLRSVRCVALQSPLVEDADLERLKGFSDLEFLMLDGAQVTDAGLEHLTGLTHLRWMSLEGTEVTDAGVARFHAVLPSCHILN